MLEIRKIRETPEAFVAGLQKRFVADAEAAVKELLDLDKQRREITTRQEELQAEMNKISKSIGQLMKQGKKEEGMAAKAKTSEIKDSIRSLSEEVHAVEASLRDKLYALPNVPHESVPIGKSEGDNVEVSRHGEIPRLPESAQPHWEIAREMDLIDWELGVKISGAGFPVYKKEGAKLLRALIHFFLDEAEAAGYSEVVPPLLINEDSGYGTGQLPDKEGQMYHVTGDDLYLIPTAEVPITNLYRDEIVDKDALPIRNCGYTQCFRREAGSYGKDVRGLNRLHQFDKVEIVEIADPAVSYERLEVMLAHASSLLEKLELPYRVLSLCTGDLGFTSAKTYDLEVWSAAQERWLEVSSVSNFETFQANRLMLRYRDGKKKHLVHTLNGSALALPRIMAALLENNQQADGSIVMPKALQPYTRFEAIRR